MNRHISMTHLMKPKPAIKVLTNYKTFPYLYLVGRIVRLMINFLCQVPIMRKSKPYTCPLCGNTFAWRSNMNRHILHLHKIDHKQLNKYLLSAYLPDVQRGNNSQTQNAYVDFFQYNSNGIYFYMLINYINMYLVTCLLGSRS